MHAIVLHEHGGPEVLRLEEVRDPEAGEGERLVHVEAAGVNRFDLNQRARGATPPAILGVDAAGWIEEDESRRRVLVTGARGAYAELTIAPAEKVFEIPDAVSAPVAAAIGVPYRTAWWSIVDLGGLEKGSRLLVQAGSSATGQACVDIGRALGAEVFATASSGKLDRLRGIGAEPLAYDDPRLETLAADVVFDPIGRETFDRSIAALRTDGRVITPGAVGDPQVAFDVWALMSKRGRVIGTGSAPVVRETMEHLIQLAAHAELKPVIDRELPLEQAAEAHRAIEERETFGKVILRP